MGGIIWLASYPKSGNTWLRVFLHNLLLNTNEPASINNLNSLTIGSSNEYWLEKVTGRPVDSFTEKEVVALTPKIHRAFTRLRSDSVFVKTHNSMSKVHGVPLITPEYTAGAIYVLRNPLDTVISLAEHFGISLDDGIDMLNDKHSVISSDTTQTAEHLGSWSNHVMSWRAVNKSALHILRYEDMLYKPEKAFGGLAKFLGLSPPKFRLKKAINFSSFDTSRKQEQEKGFIEQSDKTDRFFRVGKAGQWKNILNDDQISRVIDANFDVMEEHGYLQNSKIGISRAG
ncbi:sulfotransferase domain-containing protein [Sneathiella marina]|uniref:Sulfotransferase domain-containing protein n=1 Tax=Sneathiella marina TaxID=2950108 RepID=A0ABY4W197_9PROT|nr:sulfotransferase domain-containing protein [Sneathiella marina]USG60943.1 sulfotransferase domain-containing protein [Sneathiella marina]